MTQDEMAVMAAQELGRYGVVPGFDDMLNPSPGAIAMSEDLLAATRASEIIGKIGGMTREEFSAVMLKMVEMVNGPTG